jgi:hypothetical protein
MPNPPDDDKTSFVGTPRRGEDAAPTEYAGGARNRRLPWPARDSAAARSDPPTEPIAGPSRIHSQAEDGRTHLVSPFGSAAASQREDVCAEAIPDPRQDDPVVGWLVIVAGPGKGRSFEVGVGANSIGRGADQRISLAWGDQHISRERHAVLIFEPLHMRFFLQSGDTKNLTYMNGTLVMTPAELLGGETISIGNTSLRFVPLCGPTFTWKTV